MLSMESIAAHFFNNRCGLSLLIQWGKKSVSVYENIVRCVKNDITQYLCSYRAQVCQTR